MVEIDNFKCEKCDFFMPPGWGWYGYTIGKNGKRIECPHPLDFMIAAGSNSYCVCLDCLEQFEIDLKKDKRKCPKCKSTSIKTELELINNTCPKCKIGKVIRVVTGIVT